MTTIRAHRRFGARYFLINGLSMLPFIPVFVFIWRRASSGIWDHWTWLGIGVFVAGAIFGLWFQHHRARRFTCPECGQLIVGPIGSPGPGDPIDFLCQRCDIRWKTGLVEWDEE